MDSVILVAKSRKSPIESVLEAERKIRKYNPDILGVLISSIHEQDFIDFTQYYNVNIDWPIHNTPMTAAGSYPS
jgi:hypothetical protein